jgi:N-acetylglucosaminyldiphosphoundecaprenol N-acetyl-beta-D-mannosaminyltransferase
MHARNESHYRNTIANGGEVSCVPAFQVLGSPVHATQIAQVVAQMISWIQGRESCHYIAVTGMHGIMEARQDVCFKNVLRCADLVVPDGMPLVWLGRFKGYSLPRRVYGPELMETFCRITKNQFRHFFYGAAPGVAEVLARTLRERYDIRIAGAFSPPFRVLTEQEEIEVAALISSAAADVLWVGMGTPKQERWMYDHCDHLKIPVMVGVGAAFDFATNNIKQAPLWMREHGLEWLFRLVQEPSRLWRRYLVKGPQFAWNASLEVLGIRQFD